MARKTKPYPFTKKNLADLDKAMERVKDSMKTRIVVTQGDNLSWVAERQRRKKKRWRIEGMASGSTPMHAVWRLVGAK